MSVETANIEFHLTCGSGVGTTNSDIAKSLGGNMSSVQVSATLLNNLFEDITAEEALAGGGINDAEEVGWHYLDFKAISIKNSAAVDLVSPKIWTGSASEGSSDVKFKIGYDDDPAQTVANRKTKPTWGVNFEPCISEAGALALPVSITAGGSVRIWIGRKLTTNAASYSNDQLTLTVKGQTV